MMRKKMSKAKERVADRVQQSVDDKIYVEWLGRVNP